MRGFKMKLYSFLLLIYITSTYAAEEGWGPWSSWKNSTNDANHEYRERECVDESLGCTGYYYELTELIVVITSGSYSSSSSSSSIITDSSSLTLSYGESWEYEEIGSWDPVYDNENNIQDHAEDFEDWSQWMSKDDGWQYRTRKCKDTTRAQCRAFDSQRRKKHTSSGNSNWEYFYLETSVTEVETDWQLWGTWILTEDGYWTRSRKCKSTKPAECRGHTMQKRRRRGWAQEDYWTFIYDKTIVEEASDWELWGEWQGPSSAGTFSRSRVCKNSPTCRGVTKQERKRRVKNFIERWDYVDCEGHEGEGEVEEVEHAGDFHLWMDWQLDLDGTWIRRRKCKNEDIGPCRGRQVRRRRRKSYFIENGWEFSMDFDAPQEVASDFEQWSEWKKTDTGYWVSMRKCINSQCRGRSTRRRKQVTDEEEEEEGPGALTAPPVNGFWGEWSQWSLPQGPENKISRTRLCDRPLPGVGGADCTGSSIDLKYNPVAGNWGEWEIWPSPTYSSNPETLRRTRKCNNPEPSGGGSECSGMSLQTMTMNHQIDGKYTKWSEWVEIEDGNTAVKTEQRTRTCTNPATANGGKVCVGPASALKTTNEPVKGGWSEWSQWTTPLKQFNPETISRIRACDDPTPLNGGAACVGISQETRIIKHPIDGMWGLWGAWPTPAEGVTSITRTRQCNNPPPLYLGNPCDGSDEDHKPVQIPQDGEWSNWGAFSKKQGITNPEELIRKRVCNNPSPANGGEPCSGEDVDRLKFYTPINGDWSIWLSWSEPVEGEDTVSRVRVCNNPAVRFEGLDCLGKSQEFRNIIKPVDGGWSEWLPFSMPDFLFNPSTIYRTRHCNNPVPSMGGASCPGKSIETKEVTRPINGAWSDWTLWIFASGSDVLKTRTRKCNNPVPKFEGDVCPGKEKESQVVNKVVDGVWGDWGPFSQRTGLNPEIITRRRYCDSPRPSNGGAGCEGDDTETTTTYIPINGRWGVWSQWQLRDGLYVRLRSCNNPKPIYDGEPCEGESIETKERGIECPSGYDKVGKKCFKLVTRKLSWEDANFVCKQLNPVNTLLSVKDAASQTHLDKYFKSKDAILKRKCYNKKKDNLMVWTGAKHTKNSPTGEFYWMPEGTKATYTSWYRKAKKNVGKVEGDQCVHFKYTDYKWAYGPCDCMRKQDVQQVKLKEEERIRNEKNFYSWGVWTKNCKGKYVRSRSCKLSNGRCIGKTRGEAKWYEIDLPGKEWELDPESVSANNNEVAEDWLEWGRWRIDSNGWYVRRRSCRNPAQSGKCRGAKAFRRRVRIIKVDTSVEEEGPDALTEMVVDDTNEPDGTVEIAADWQMWGEWELDAKKRWFRRRIRRAGIKVGRGRSIQRRRRRNWIRIGRWVYDSEGSEIEKLADWKVWSEWTRNSKGWFFRRRLCKKKNPCRGARSQVRRRRGWRVKGFWWKNGWRSGYGSGLNLDDMDNFEMKASEEEEEEEGDPENWRNWSIWKKGGNGWWKRTRACKEGKTCRGATFTMKRRIKYDIINGWKYQTNYGKPTLFKGWGRWTKDTENNYFYRTRSCRKFNAACVGNRIQKKMMVGWSRNRRQIKWWGRGDGSGAGWNSKMRLYRRYRSFGYNFKNRVSKIKQHAFLSGRRQGCSTSGWGFEWGWGNTGALSWGGLSGIKGVAVHEHFDYDNSIIRPYGAGYGLGLGIDGLSIDLNLGVGDLNWPYGNWHYRYPKAGFSYADENPDNWYSWGEWVSIDNLWFIRKRRCKNQGNGASCEGVAKQERRERSWVIKGFWQVEKLIGGESGRWEKWSRWEDEFKNIGLSFRVRTCNGECKGAKMQRRKMRGYKWGYGWGWHLQQGAWLKGWNWNTHNNLADLDLDKAASIKTVGHSGWNWKWRLGEASQMNSLLTWWDWLVGNKWSFQADFKQITVGGRRKWRFHWKKRRSCWKKWLTFRRGRRGWGTSYGWSKCKARPQKGLKRPRACGRWKEHRGHGLRKGHIGKKGGNWFTRALGRIVSHLHIGFRGGRKGARRGGSSSSSSSSSSSDDKERPDNIKVRSNNHQRKQMNIGKNRGNQYHSVTHQKKKVNVGRSIGNLFKTVKNAFHNRWKRHSGKISKGSSSKDRSSKGSRSKDRGSKGKRPKGRGSKDSSSKDRSSKGKRPKGRGSKYSSSKDRSSKGRSSKSRGSKKRRSKRIGRRRSSCRDSSSGSDEEVALLKDTFDRNSKDVEDFKKKRAKLNWDGINFDVWNEAEFQGKRKCDYHMCSVCEYVVGDETDSIPV